MGDYQTFFRSFAGGEVTPEFYGQIADNKFQTGVALARNFMVMPHGPLGNRPGTKFVRPAKYSFYETKLIPFTYSFDQTLVIEFGHLYFRFHTMGATVMSGASPYEVAHTYTDAQLGDVQFTQSGDIITLVHPLHPPRELKRLGAVSWTLTDIAFGSLLTPPGGTGGAATPGATPGTPYDTDYVVTAVSGTDESLVSATVTVSNNLFDDGAFNTISWAAAAGAARYSVYKRSSGLYGYIGQTEALEFIDDNIAPDTGHTPPIEQDLFDGANDYPRAVGYFDQRRGFASTINEPQNVWLSKSGTESNFNYSIPAQDADSLQFKLAARGGDAILHMVPMADLILTTAATIWRVSGGVTDILTPATITARPQGVIGAAAVTPVVAGNMIYVAAAGGHLREFGYSQDKNGYTSGDISIRAPHLFDGYEVKRLSLALSPWPIVWAVSSSGKLLGLTYVPEQNIGAWHQHDTLGVFEDVVTVTENGQSVSYFVIRRTINGAQQRYIEYMQPLASRAFVDQASQYFVDCGMTWDSQIDGTGSPVATLSGFDWLEGETVSILADGAVCPQIEVTAGTITIPEAAHTIHVGLPYVADLQTLPVALDVPAYAQAMIKNINQVHLRVYASSGIFAGPSFDDLTEAKQRTIEPLGSPPNLRTGVVDIVVQPSWSDDGAVCVRQSDPLALTVVSLALDLALGGG